MDIGINVSALSLGGRENLCTIAANIIFNVWLEIWIGILNVNKMIEYHHEKWDMRE